LSSNSASVSGGFGSLASAEHTTGGFGSSGGFGSTSPFAAKTSSGFGGLGSSGFSGLGGSSLGGTLGGVGGFGGARPLGRGLSSFAAPLGSATTFGGPSSAKAFGAPAQEDEGDSEDDDGDDSDDEAAIMDRPKERRFQEQERKFRQMPFPVSNLCWQQLMRLQLKRAKKQRRLSFRAEQSSTTSKAKSGKNEASAHSRSTLLGHRAQKSRRSTSRDSLCVQTVFTGLC
jgi:hypothetical protein